MISKVFLKGHEREGQSTDFIKKILDNKKIHTLRTNIKLWEKRFEKIEDGQACISLRYWEDKPYKSKQIEFKRLTKEDGVGLEIFITAPSIAPLIVNTTKDVTTRSPLFLIAKNDGLFQEDFISFFKNKRTNLVIIHFTNFRYIN